MTMDFYTDNEQRAPVTGNYLFSDEITQIMCGQFISDSGKRYQVNALQWNDEHRKLLNVFVFDMSSLMPANPLTLTNEEAKNN